MQVWGVNAKVGQRGLRALLLSSTMVSVNLPERGLITLQGLRLRCMAGTKKPFRKIQPRRWFRGMFLRIGAGSVIGYSWPLIGK